MSVDTKTALLESTDNLRLQDLNWHPNGLNRLSTHPLSTLYNSYLMLGATRQTANLANQNLTVWEKNILGNPAHELASNILVDVIAQLEHLDFMRNSLGKTLNREDKPSAQRFISDLYSYEQIRNFFFKPDSTPRDIVDIMPTVIADANSGNVFERKFRNRKVMGLQESVALADFPNSLARQEEYERELYSAECYFALLQSKGLGSDTESRVSTMATRALAMIYQEMGLTRYADPGVAEEAFGLLESTLAPLKSHSQWIIIQAIGPSPRSGVSPYKSFVVARFGSTLDAESLSRIFNQRVIVESLANTQLVGTFSNPSES